MIPQREMTLDEWCQRLPPEHLVNKQLKELTTFQNEHTIKYDELKLKLAETRTRLTEVMIENDRINFNYKKAFVMGAELEKHADKLAASVDYYAPEDDALAEYRKLKPKS